ncbi:MAG: hypothetical protein KatS3mg003_0782 [Candidatus Nitrosocaldaceae archaeon]|nr:MAG: hypothetical protein KatS3mg003_0782 [Candidatus Nitrosocaldaceae archaeon]
MLVILAKIIRKELEGYVNDYFIEHGIEFRCKITDIDYYGILFEIEPIKNTQSYFDAIEMASMFIDKYVIEHMPNYNN